MPVAGNPANAAAGDEELRDEHATVADLIGR